MKERGTKGRISGLVFCMLSIMAMVAGCTFTPPDAPEKTIKTAALDLQQFNRREELAILKAQPSNTVSVDTLQNIANGILKTKNDSRSAGGGKPAIISEVNKLPSLTDKRFTKTVNNGRSLENNTIEEEPVELYCFTIENPDEENDGFILTSNDDRIGYVLAVVDDGDLTDTENPFVEVFTTKLTDYIEETITEYDNITTEETQAAIEKWYSIDPEARTLTAHWGIVGDDYVATGTVVSDFTKVIDKVIKTQWGQGAPYNAYVDYYQDRNNKLGPKNYIAGCGPVAVAQLVAYYGYIPNTNKPDSFTIGSGSTTAKWNKSSSYDFAKLTAQPTIGYTSGTASEELRGQVAALMHQVGLSIPADYKDGSTGADTTKTANLLRNGWSYKSDYTDFIAGTTLTETYNSSTITYKNNSKDWVVRHLTAKPKAHPLIIVGYRLDGTEKIGHEWLIDGYGTMTYYTEYLNKKGSTLVYSSTLTLTNCIMVHCNLGWNGSNDGWYIYGIFDTGHMAALDGHKGEDGGTKRFYSHDITLFAPYR